MKTPLLFGGTNPKICHFENNYYLKQDNYYKLRQKLDFKEINFIHSPVQNLYTNITSDYDLMFLSNINNYLSQIYDGIGKERYQKYRNYIITELFHNLNEGGQIAAAYLYGTQNNEQITDTFSPVARKIDFNSSFGYHCNDSALILKKIATSFSEITIPIAPNIN